MTQNQYQTLVSCPECGNTQPFGGNMEGKRPHFKCSACKKFFDVLPNLEPIAINHANDVANNNSHQINLDTYSDKVGNIYVENANDVPTIKRKKKNLPYAVTFNPSDTSFLRTFHIMLYGYAPGHSKNKGFDYICDSLILRIEELKQNWLAEKRLKELGKL